MSARSASNRKSLEGRDDERRGSTAEMIYVCRECGTKTTNRSMCCISCGFVSFETIDELESLRRKEVRDWKNRAWDVAAIAESAQAGESAALEEVARLGAGTPWATLVTIYKAIEGFQESVGGLKFVNRLCPVCGARFSDGASEEDEDPITVKEISDSIS